MQYASSSFPTCDARTGERAGLQRPQRGALVGVPACVVDAGARWQRREVGADAIAPRGADGTEERVIGSLVLLGHLQGSRILLQAFTKQAMGVLTARSGHQHSGLR